MSWQDYVDSHLVGTGKVKKAAILGQQGGVWATSDGYELSAQEQAAVLDAFDNPGEARASGIRLAGTKYIILNADDQSVHGKASADGFVLARTRQAVLVTEYIAPIQHQEAFDAVEKLADYLREKGY